MQIWHSPSLVIPVRTFSIDVHADSDAVDIGKTINHVYASDLRLTPDEADVLWPRIREASIQCRAMRAKP